LDLFDYPYSSTFFFFIVSWRCCCCLFHHRDGQCLNVFFLSFFSRLAKMNPDWCLSCRILELGWRLLARPMSRSNNIPSSPRDL
jgi:hypothetical protein